MHARDLIRCLLQCVHVLAGAAWLGAMLYSLFVVQPRAQRFFGLARPFEEFAAILAAGARWKVLTGCGLIAATGIGLLFFLRTPMTDLARRLLMAKTFFFGLSIIIFCFISWKLWPARLMASPNEVPRFQKQFRTLAALLILLVTLSFLSAIIGAHL